MFLLNLGQKLGPSRGKVFIHQTHLINLEKLNSFAKTFY